MSVMEEVIADRMQLRDVLTKTANRYPHLSCSALARLYQVSPTEAWSVLSAAGVDRPRRSPNDELTAESVRTDREAGLSVQAMARKYDVSVSHIHRNLREVAPVNQPVTEHVREKRIARSVKRSPSPDPDEVARLRLEERLTYDQIAARLNVSKTTVYDAARARGLTGHGRLADQAAAAGHDAGYVHQSSVTGTPSGWPNTIFVPTATLPTNEPAEEYIIARPIVSPPLLTLSRQGCTGELARRRLVRLIAVLEDDVTYDVEFVVREVMA